MSSRVLRKLQNDKEKELIDEISDVEADIPVGGGARKKQLNLNRYDLLNQHSHSESEVKEDDNETEAPKSCEGEVHHESVKRKKKKKKKKSGKTSYQPSSEDNAEANADLDEVERSVREVNRLLGESHVSNVPQSNSNKVERRKNTKSILSVQHKHLNPNNELKRIFGSKIIQAEQHKKKNRGGRSSHQRQTWMSNCKENWPQVGRSGLSMSLLESKNGLQNFTYEHSQNYRQVQNKFFEAVESLDPNNIVAVINEHPYHVDALLQLSDLCRLSEDLPMAAEFVERALFCLECALHPLFNMAQGNCRLDYRRQENRALYITIFKHIIYVGGRACWRTALEFGKLLLSLDPEGDPLAVILAIDFYALRAREHTWLKEFATELEHEKNLSQLPNFAFSTAVAHFYTCSGDTQMADSLLQNALLMFPSVLKPLLEKCSVQIDNRVQNHTFFAIDSKKKSSSLDILIQLYISRSYHVWKDSDLLPWLEKNVHEVLDRVDRNDSIVKDYERKRLTRFQGSMPLNISRHIILSDIKEVSPGVEESEGPVMTFDPLPPKDSINIYTRPKKLQLSLNTSTSPLALFFRSLLPSFNNGAAAPLAENAGPNMAALQLNLDEGAAALPEANANIGRDLRETVAELVGSMRHLLENIRPEHQNDDDNNENDGSDEEDNT